MLLRNQLPGLVVRADGPYADEEVDRLCVR
jgi:hypothetical protein